MRILLADDHPLFAEALKTLIERSLPDSRLTIAQDLATAHRALSSSERFDLAILDLYMPGAEGFAGIESTLARFPDIPLIVISGVATPTEVARSLALGARGFLPKTLPSKVLAAALQVVAAGGTYVPADYALSERHTPSQPSEPAAATVLLTQREQQVLVLLSDGLSNKEIARALEVEEITVKLHARNIYRKLGVRNRVEASNAASRLNLTGAMPASASPNPHC
jgi:DNA-binding NarL/FixJ family response regulator